MFPSRYISLVIPKANTSFGRLSFQFSAANDWNELQKLLKLDSYISLCNFKHQLSEQLTVPVHIPSVNNTPNYLIPKLLFILLLFCTPVSPPPHHHLHIYHSSVNAKLSLFLPLQHIYCLTSLFFYICTHCTLIFILCY
ncbi:unnamed protein product [Oncorhynchus mykiss]|uniref:Uncharacterized protein n=1 Tax=Oncorhynchus mykiss TaxID=8022 RepID=A0A060YB64_ONCMY|nr:unnamed protein product [Oncorhynchus mykiss]